VGRGRRDVSRKGRRDKRKIYGGGRLLPVHPPFFNKGGKTKKIRLNVRKRQVEGENWAVFQLCGRAFANGELSTKKKEKKKKNLERSGTLTGSRRRNETA